MFSIERDFSPSVTRLFIPMTILESALERPFTGISRCLIWSGEGDREGRMAEAEHGLTELVEYPNKLDHSHVALKPTPPQRISMSITVFCFSKLYLENVPLSPHSHAPHSLPATTHSPLSFDIFAIENGNVM